MDVNSLLDHVAIMEAQSRNEETMRIEEEALHRETKSQLHAMQEVVALMKEREKQLVEKNANLTALKDTLETSVNQLTGDLKGYKSEMSILKEFAVKQEALLKVAKLDYLRKLEDINDTMRKRNEQLDQVLARVRGESGPQDAQSKEASEELGHSRNEVERLRNELEDIRNEHKAQTEELEKDRKYPIYLLYRKCLTPP